MEQEWSYDDDELIEMAELFKVFGNSTRILDLMDSASEGRSKTETLITRFSQKYTPCVVIAALVLAVVPPLFTGFNFAPWIHRALNFLVVSCPCALVISVPLAFFGGMGGVSKAGMIAKGGVALENLAKVDTVVFHKTGTLTTGDFQVVRVDSDLPDLVELVAAAEALSSLKKLGISEMCMLTGDRETAAKRAAEGLGMDSFRHSLLPQDKLNEVEQMQQHGRRVAFVGDGVNDAPVLTLAYVGVAMGGVGSDAAVEASDLVLLKDDLRGLPGAIRIARRTIANAKQSIVFALAVKFGVMALSIPGIANMWLAVFADVGVAILCILNSFRAMKAKD